MSLTASARSIPGSLRQEIVIDGRHHLTTDEPEEVGGEGSAPAPHELLPAALAGCISTGIVMYARLKKWDIGDVSVDVDYDHKATPRRFEIAITIDIGFVTQVNNSKLSAIEITYTGASCV